MHFLHSMVRVTDIDASLKFYCDGLGLKEVRRSENEAGRFTLVFLASPDDIAKSGVNADSKLLPKGAPMIELTYNWDPEPYSGGRNFGHLACEVKDIYALCARLAAMGYVIHRPPRDGRMAFIKSPDGISVELLQQGEALEASEPWASMENTGSW